MNPDDYKNAVDGRGDPILVANWKDKPHRLVYDLVDENKLLRMLLWLRHDDSHYSGLYGDDGEMQCGECLIDFKRDSVKAIQDRFQQISLEKYAKAKLSTKG